MKAPEVSVVIPTHNRRDLLALTLASALWQEDVDLEVIVVDDGSSDGSGETVAALHDARVRLIRHETPEGVSSARNDGIDEAAGEWVAFLDDDDLWAPAKLRAQLNAARSGSTWAYTGVVKIDERQRVIGGRPPPSPREVVARLPRWNLVPGGCSGVIAARNALVSIGQFDRRLVNLADWDLWIRLGRTGLPACAPDPLVAYRSHRGQASLDVRLIMREADLVDGKYGQRMDRGALHHYLAHRCLVGNRPRSALNHFARAAFRGEMVPVTTDLSRLMRARLARWGRVPERPDLDVAWRGHAAGWLRELQDHVDFHSLGSRGREDPVNPSTSDG
jgi:glycosyltransferase involved in cell wall biosynthesis